MRCIPLASERPFQKPTRWGRKLSEEIQAHADSLDEFVTIDDIYNALTNLAREVRNGEWG